MSATTAHSTDALASAPVRHCCSSWLLSAVCPSPSPPSWPPLAQRRTAPAAPAPTEDLEEHEHQDADQAQPAAADGESAPATEAPAPAVLHARRIEVCSLAVPHGWAPSRSPRS